MRKKQPDKEISQSVITFSKRLTALRTGETLNTPKYTQGEIAKSLGIIRDTYTRYENYTTPPLETIVNICKMFGVSSDYLLGLIDTPNPPIPQPKVEYLVPLSSEIDYNKEITEYDESFQMTRNEISLIEGYRRLPEDLKEHYSALISREY